MSSQAGSFRFVEYPYLNLALWAAGAAMAVGILMSMMRRRRDQLVQALQQYVQRQRDPERNKSGGRSATNRKQ